MELGERDYDDGIFLHGQRASSQKQVARNEKLLFSKSNFCSSALSRL